MPPSSKWPKTAPEVVYVLDTCALINMKRFELLRHAEQFPMFAHMTELLRAGTLCLPRQVATEMSHWKYADIPGGWASGYQHVCIFPTPSVVGILSSCRLSPCVLYSN